MASLWQGGRQILNMVNGNTLLAHLQTAAFERFAQGKGFFITMYGGTDNDGRSIPATAVWCSPSVAMRFAYDEYDEAVEINSETIEVYLRAMNDPHGVLIGPGAGSSTWPFTLLKTDRPGLPDDDEQPDQ